MNDKKSPCCEIGFSVSLDIYQLFTVFRGFRYRFKIQNILFYDDNSL